MSLSGGAPSSEQGSSRTIWRGNKSLRTKISVTTAIVVAAATAMATAMATAAAVAAMAEAEKVTAPFCRGDDSDERRRQRRRR